MSGLFNKRIIMKQSNTPIELLEQRAKEFEGTLLEDKLNGDLSEYDMLTITSQLLQEIQFLHSQNIAFTRSIAPNHFKVDANNKVVATGFEHAQVTDNPEHFKKDILALGVMLKGVFKIENLGIKDANRIVKSMINPTQEFSLSHAIEGFDRVQQQYIRKRHNIDSTIHHSLDELYDLAEGNTEFKKGLEDEAAQQFKIIEALSKVIEKTAFDDHVSPANKEQIQEELRQRMHSYNDTLIQLEERKISERKINVRIQRKEALLASRLADLTIFTIPSNASKESLKKLDKDLENKLSKSADENEKVILEEIYENVHSCLEKKSADNLTYHDIKIPLMSTELAYFSDIELHLDEEA